MARRGETMYAETPDRNHLTIFRCLQMRTRGLPAEEIDIPHPKIYRHLATLQNLIDPICMVRMAVRKTNPHQAQLARRQDVDHRWRIVCRVDEYRLSAVMNHIALHPIAIDRSPHCFHPGDRGRDRRFPLPNRNLLQRTRTES